MKAIAKRELKNYLKRPLFWLGVIIVIFGVYQNVKPYLMLHYVDSEDEIKKPAQEEPKIILDADIIDGYVPTKEEDRRDKWERIVQKALILEFQMEKAEAEAVIEEMKGMDVRKASEYLEREYHFYNTFYSYEDTRYHQGTKEEINAYMKSKLARRSFSYYFSKKFADFAGLYMGFFATIMLAVLFWQDTRKNTYELLHTKPVSAGKYVFGKIAGGFLVCLVVLAILNLVFWMVCCIFTRSSGFEVHFIDFLVATSLYILPNMLMIVSVHALISVLFKNPLPAVPLLILYMIYSNLGSRNAEGVFDYYGRPLAIMVRFPGQFFDTAPPPMAMMNQSFLVLASVGMSLFCVWIWKRRG